MSSIFESVYGSIGNMPLLYASRKSGIRVHVDDATHHDELKCPCCDSRVFAKRGHVKAHHFAHAPGTSCDISNRRASKMTAWHRKWQDSCLPEFVEVRMFGDDGKIAHIADIKTHSGTVVELQHSSMTTREAHERECFYGHDMIWIVDADPDTTSSEVLIHGSNFIVIKAAYPFWIDSNRLVIIHVPSLGLYTLTYHIRDRIVLGELIDTSFLITGIFGHTLRSQPPVTPTPNVVPSRLYLDAHTLAIRGYTIGHDRQLYEIGTRRIPGTSDRRLPGVMANEFRAWLSITRARKAKLAQIRNRVATRRTSRVRELVRKFGKVLMDRIRSTPECIARIRARRFDRLSDNIDIKIKIRQKHHMDRLDPYTQCQPTRKIKHMLFDARQTKLSKYYQK